MSIVHLICMKIFEKNSNILINKKCILMVLRKVLSSLESTSISMIHSTERVKRGLKYNSMEMCGKTLEF